jgi:DNA-directed RNA polymerases I, II, and III subunit RPABC2
MNAPVLINVGNESDPLRIAMKELKEGRIPFIVRRSAPESAFACVWETCKGRMPRQGCLQSHEAG